MENSWLDRRDLRTDSYDRVNTKYKKKKVHIEIVSDSGDYTVQLMTTGLLNILSRWCRSISLSCKNAPYIIGPRKGTLLLEELALMAKSNTPDIAFSVNPMVAKADITVSIGGTPSDISRDFIAIDGGGWIASCAFNGYGECDRTQDQNPIGAMFAASLANAELFRWANELLTQDYCKWYDLHTLEVSSDTITVAHPYDNKTDLGRVHLIGCGAIGSCFTYMLGLTQFSGDVMFCDFDKVKIHNLPSSLIFKAADIDRRKKVDLCIKQLSETNIQTSAFRHPYSKYAYNGLDLEKSADVILCFANEQNIWSTIQKRMPPLTFHATTSKTWGVNVGRHLALKDNCINCTFEDIATVVEVRPCSEVDMSYLETIEGQEPSVAILPFLSPMAAILAFGELVKCTQGITKPENTFQFNAMASTGRFVSDFQGAKPCNICRDHDESLHLLVNSHTKYWYLSVENRIKQ